jgi:hypothetical protein
MNQINNTRPHVWFLDVRSSFSLSKNTLPNQNNEERCARQQFRGLWERIRKAGCLVLMRRGDREQAAGAHHLIKIMKSDASASSFAVCRSASEKQDVWI